MVSLNLPHSNLQIREINGKPSVFDILRKKYVVLTSEEWVRQNFVHFLINSCCYPKGLMKLESGLKYNEMAGRSDILIYNRKGEVFMLVECKASEVSLTNKVFEQASRYNSTIKARYLTITNGINHFCCEIDRERKEYSFLKDLPSYQE
jgi:hypothetical protein